MKRLVDQILTGASQPESWWSYAALTLGFGPLALLFVFMPDAIILPACYALGAACALLASFLIQARSRYLRTDLASRTQARDGRYADTVDMFGLGITGHESVVSILSRDLTPSLPPTLLGMLRIVNYDRMAAFDVAIADRFLEAFQQRLRNALGKSRTLARIERNCFAIWFSGDGDAEAARAELQALGYALSQQIQSDAFAIQPELEIGSATTGSVVESPAELISRALASLTRPATRLGTPGASREVSTDEMRRRFTLEQDLRHAIGNGELALHYQPFIDTAAMRVTGAEALLRWNHPELGLISPVEFIPILEGSGLMQDVGIWVLNTACRQLREWRAAGDDDFRMAINLSARQLQDPELETIISRTVQNHGLTSSSIELELTETAAMEDSALTLRLFSSLREAGFSLAIDDFGSGYSSLSYLKNLPFNKLKIDREFVSHVDESRESAAICKALLELAAGLGISALAEGVERREEVDALVRMGCTNFQGFYFAKPMNAEVFAATTSDPDWLAGLSSPAAGLHKELKRRYS